MHRVYNGKLTYMSRYGSSNNSEYRAPIMDSSSARAVGVEQYLELLLYCDG